MKTRIAISFYMILIWTASICAQTKITKDHQGFRSGDALYKQQVEFKDPGRSGVNVVWDFSKLKPINEHYLVRFFEPSKNRSRDTVFLNCLENRTLYKYASKGDSVILMGFENQGTKLTLSSPELTMHYPFVFGDSIVSHYKGSGAFASTLSSGIQGDLYVVADALGTLILPDGDTLRKVLRVKTVHRYLQHTKLYCNPSHDRIRKNTKIDSCIISSTIESEVAVPDSAGTEQSTSKSVSIQKVKNAKKIKGSDLSQKRDSICFRTVSFAWYAQGYRYPLFETIYNHTRKAPTDTTEMDDIATAFYFPPSEHSYLENDPLNKAILDSLRNVKYSATCPGDTLLFDFNYFPNPVRNDLNVELLLDFPSNVSFSIYTITGHKVYTKECGWHDAGQHYFTLQLSSLRMDEYLIYIKVNEQTARASLMKL